MNPLTETTMKDLITELRDTAKAMNAIQAEGVGVFTCAHCATVFETQIERNVHEAKCRGTGSVASIVSIRKHFNVQITEPVPGHWKAIDLVTFDHDPLATRHVIGWGRTTEEAVIDLFEKLAAVVVTEAFANRKPL